MAVAIVPLEPGGLNVMMVPFGCRRKPTEALPALYDPVIWPVELMA